MTNYETFNKEFLEWHFGFMNNDQRAEAFIKSMYNQMESREYLEVEKMILDSEPKEGYVLRDKETNQNLLYSNGTDIVAFKDDSDLLNRCKKLMSSVSDKHPSLNLRMKISDKDLEDKI